MAVLSFAKTDEDTVWLRKAIFRMILSRAKARSTTSDDIQELELSQAMEGISFHRLDVDQRARVLEAVYDATQSLKDQIAAGQPTEEPVLPGIEENLDEILALLARFRQ